MARIAFVCEGGGSIGWGHVGRGRALAEGDKTVSLLVGRGFEEVAAWAKRSRARFEISPWQSSDDPIDFTSSSWTSVVVDAYDLPNEWLEKANRHAFVAVVDDWQRANFRCDALINANVGASANDYRAASYARGLFGTSYALVRREIVTLRSPEVRPAGRRPRLLISLGGSDPADVASQVVSQLSGAGILTRCDTLVIVGESYTGELTKARPASNESFEIQRQPEDFAVKLASADLIICGGSVTSYEAACLGRPFVPVAIVGNQRRITSTWAALGWGRDIVVTESGWTDRLLSCVDLELGDARASAARARDLSRLVDGRGTERVRAVLK